jgi:hypothetical protein
MARNGFCLICYETLSAEGVKPSKLKWFLETSYTDLTNEPSDCFIPKYDEIKPN